MAVKIYRKRSKTIAGKQLSQSPNAIRLRRLRRKAVRAGKCLVCRMRVPKPRHKICDHCNGTKVERAASYIARGLCACGNKCERGKLRCTLCRITNEKARKRRDRRLVLAGRCRNCGHGWPKPGAKTCPSCIANINAYGVLRAAVNHATGLCACGRERMPGYERCKRCRGIERRSS